MQMSIQIFSMYGGGSPFGRRRTGTGHLRLALMWLLVFSPAMAQSGAYFRNDGQQIAMGNPQVELAFSAATGGLLNLVDKSTDTDFLNQKNAYWNGFTFSYTAPGSTALQYGGGYLAQSVTFTPENTSNGIQVAVQFSNFIVNGSSL